MTTGVASPEPLKVEVKYHVVAYDLPTKTVEVEKDSNKDRRKKAIRMWEQCRLWCTEKLHKLGLPTTMSVILTARSREEIEWVIEQVRERYRRLSEELVRLGYSPVREPVIKVIPVLEFQWVHWKDLAEMNLRERLQRILEDLRKLAEAVRSIVVVSREDVRKAKDRLAQIRRRYRELIKKAQELDIVVEEMDMVEGAMESIVTLIREME